MLYNPEIQENNFCCVEEILAKTNFLNFQYFLYKKKHSKHVRVLAVCNTQENIFLIYMYICHISSKTRYSKYEIDIFLTT